MVEVINLPVVMSDADINMPKTFVDRYDENKTKVFAHNKEDDTDYGLAFQQAVNKMAIKMQVDIR